MSAAGAGFRGRTLALFVGVLSAVVAALVAIGYWPTVRIAGPAAVPAMLAGCAVSWFAGLAGALPVLFAGALGGQPGQPRTMAALLATVVRMMVAALAGLVLALLGAFPKAPLLLWLGISYVALLPVESWFVLRSPQTGK